MTHHNRLLCGIFSKAVGFLFNQNIEFQTLYSVHHMHSTHHKEHDLIY